MAHIHHGTKSWDGEAGVGYFPDTNFPGAVEYLFGSPPHTA